MVEYSCVRSIPLFSICHLYSGLAGSRSEATHLAQRMLSLGLICSVSEERTHFSDSYCFFRFWCDEVRNHVFRAIPIPLLFVHESHRFRLLSNLQLQLLLQDDSVELNLAEGSADELSSDQSNGRKVRWRFAPHTAHNSLVLDVALATEVCSSYMIMVSFARMKST